MTCELLGVGSTPSSQCVSPPLLLCPWPPSQPEVGGPLGLGSALAVWPGSPASSAYVLHAAAQASLPDGPGSAPGLLACGALGRPVPPRGPLPRADAMTLPCGCRSPHSWHADPAASACFPLARSACPSGVCRTCSVASSRPLPVGPPFALLLNVVAPALPVQAAALLRAFPSALWYLPTHRLYAYCALSVCLARALFRGAGISSCITLRDILSAYTVKGLSHQLIGK